MHTFQLHAFNTFSSKNRNRRSTAIKSGGAFAAKSGGHDVSSDQDLERGIGTHQSERGNCPAGCDRVPPACINDQLCSSLRKPNPNL